MSFSFKVCISFQQLRLLTHIKLYSLIFLLLKKINWKISIISLSESTLTLNVYGNVFFLCWRFVFFVFFEHVIKPRVLWKRVFVQKFHTHRIAEGDAWKFKLGGHPTQLFWALKYIEVEKFLRSWKCDISTWIFCLDMRVEPHMERRFCIKHSWDRTRVSWITQQRYTTQ